MHRHVSPAAPNPQLTLDPAPSAWPRPAPPTDDAIRLRTELGLPTDRPIIMTGHQPEFWHPGILAKDTAASAFAAKHNAATAHVAVDTDEVDPGLVTFPAQVESRWIRREARLLPKPAIGVPAAAAPAAPPSPIDADAPKFILDGLHSIHAALAQHAGASNLAEQTSLALADLMRPVAPIDHHFGVSRLPRTSLFRDIIARMMQDPRACAEAHNRAVAARPQSHIAPLAIEGERIELPLWRIRANRARAKVFADQLATIPIEELAPRAVLLTGLLRLGACELFIHGTGAREYDRVTDAWLNAWLRRPLAPAVIASATLLLPLDAHDIPTPDDIARAQWIAHHARHDPALLSDAAAARQKQSLLADVRAARDSGADARPAYLRLQQFLTDYRSAHADQLGALAAEARSLAERRAEAEVIADRTWPFPLHPRESLEALRDSLTLQFA